MTSHDEEDSACIIIRYNTIYTNDHNNELCNRDDDDNNNNKVASARGMHNSVMHACLINSVLERWCSHLLVENECWKRIIFQASDVAAVDGLIEDVIQKQQITLSVAEYLLQR